MTSYLIRVRQQAEGYTATLRKLEASGHPEDLAMTDVLATGIALTAPAAMLAAICNATIPELPSEPNRGRYAC